MTYTTPSSGFIVKQTLTHLSYRPTTLLIAHRFSMVRDADHVIVLDEGRIREQGPPGQLIAAGGWFSRFAMQAAQNGQEA